jgi:AraC-like DNA-binding protein
LQENEIKQKRASMSLQRKYQVRPALQAFRQMGICVPSVFRRAKLCGSSAEDKHLELNATSCRRLFVAAAEEYGRFDFGLQLAIQYARIPYGPGYFAFISSPNIGAAIKAIAKYKPQVSAIGCSAEQDEGDLKVEVYQTTSEFPVDSNMSLVEFAYIVELLRNCCDGFLDVKLISLRDAATAHDAYKEFFSCPITEGPVSAMWIGSRSLEIPLHAENLEIGMIAKKRLEAIYFPNLDQKDFCEQARNAAKENLLCGRVGAINAASKMGISVRTLNRKLKECDISFMDIQSDIQRHHSLELLSDINMGISEIAFRLGFKEVASFYRAFKKWHGVTPAQMRNSWKQKQNSRA